MSLVDINWNPDRRQLRNFGWAALAATAVLSILLHWVKGAPLRWVLLPPAFGMVVFVLSVVSTALTRGVYRVLVALTLPVGIAVSFVLMAGFYFLLLTPLGLVFKIIGRDPLHRKFDPGSESYWTAHSPPESPDRYFHQF